MRCCFCLLALLEVELCSIASKLESCDCSIGVMIELAFKLAVESGTVSTASIKHSSAIGGVLFCCCLKLSCIMDVRMKEFCALTHNAGVHHKYSYQPMESKAVQFAFHRLSLQLVQQTWQLNHHSWNRSDCPASVQRTVHLARFSCQCRSQRTANADSFAVG